MAAYDAALRYLQQSRDFPGDFHGNIRGRLFRHRNRVTRGRGKLNVVRILSGEMPWQERRQVQKRRRTANLFDGISDGISDFQKQKTVHPCGFAQIIQVHLSQRFNGLRVLS
jgi:hypothetical protein